MSLKANTDTPIPFPTFVKLHFYWEREGIASLEAFRADNTHVALIARTEADKERLVKLAEKIDAEIDKFRQYLDGGNKKS